MPLSETQDACTTLLLSLRPCGKKGFKDLWIGPVVTQFAQMLAASFCYSLRADSVALFPESVAPTFLSLRKPTEIIRKHVVWRPGQFWRRFC
jgi:hypothetical protein